MNQVIFDKTGQPLLFDVAGVLRTLWSRRGLIAAAAVVALIACGLYLAATPPIYTASASLLVDPRDPQATNFGGVLPAIGADSAAIASQVSVIESRSLLGAVFDDLKLSDDPELADPGLMAHLIGLVHKTPPPSREAVFERFQSHVSVDREGLTYVLNVSYKSRDSVKAAAIVNAVVTRYATNLSGERTDANNQVNSALSGKIVGLQQAVTDADTAVQDFKDKHQIFDATSGGTLQSQIDQLTTQLVAAEDQSNQAEARYQQAVADGTSPQGLVKLSEITSSTVTDKLRDDYNTEAAALANAEAIYGPRHPTVLSLEAQLSKLGGLMGDEAQRIIQQLGAARDLAASNVKTLQGRIDALRGEANQSQLAQVQLRQLQASADAARAVLDDFLKRSQQTAQFQGLQMSQVRVISSAAPPVQPSWPKPSLLLPVSAVLGLLAGCCLALGLGPALRREPAPPLPAPVSPEPGPDGARALPGRRLGLKSLGSYRLPGTSQSSPRARLKAARLELSRPDSGFADTLDRMIDQVLGRLAQHAPPHVVLFTPLEAGPERWVAAAMLALALDRLGARLLMVELAHWEREPPALRTLSGPRGSGVFTDPATGLPTLVVELGENGRPGWPESVVAEAASGCDFVVVIGPALDDPAYDRTFAADADLECFTLAADGRAAALDAAVANLGADIELGGKAMLVVDLAAGAREGFRPRLVTSHAEGGERASAAEA